MASPSAGGWASPCPVSPCHLPAGTALSHWPQRLRTQDRLLECLRGSACWVSSGGSGKALLWSLKSGIGSPLSFAYCLSIAEADHPPLEVAFGGLACRLIVFHGSFSEPEAEGSQSEAQSRLRDGAAGARAPELRALQVSAEPLVRVPARKERFRWDCFSSSPKLEKNGEGPGPGKTGPPSLSSPRSGSKLTYFHEGSISCQTGRW